MLMPSEVGLQMTILSLQQYTKRMGVRSWQQLTLGSKTPQMSRISKG